MSRRPVAIGGERRRTGLTHNPALHRLLAALLAIGLALAIPAGSTQVGPSAPTANEAARRPPSVDTDGAVDPTIPPVPEPGALPIGATSYPVPAGARFVSPAGDDSAAGTATDPWATVGHAVGTVPPGSTVVLRAGTYRERVLIPADKPITLQPFPNEAVWFSGSIPIDGWRADGKRWRLDGWAPRFGHDGLDPTLVDPAHPVAGHPDMAFLDGRPLRQVARRDAVFPGTFYVDENASQLWIGDDPRGRLVEASHLPDALIVRSAGSKILGIGFQHFASAVPQNGAVKVSGAGAVLEHDVFRRNAAAGLSVTGPDAKVRRVTASENGQLGIHAHRADRLELVSNLALGNNTEAFSPAAAAGGVKITDSVDTLVRDNRLEANNGHGLWLDVDADRCVITGNVAIGNLSGAGIMFEFSSGAVIAGNVSIRNGAGIQAGEASDVRIWNNTVVDNNTGIRVYDGERSPQPTGITVRNNMIASGPDDRGPLLHNEDVNGGRTWQEMGWNSDHNGFGAVEEPEPAGSTRKLPDLVVLADGPRSSLTFSTIEEVRNATSLEEHSVLLDASVDRLVAGAGEGVLPSTGASPAVPDGAPLDADIAEALSLPSGAMIQIGAPK